MVGECRHWRNDDGSEYVVTTAMRTISKGFFAKSEPQEVIVFEALSGDAWSTVFNGSTSLHWQPDFELRSYLGVAKHNPPTRFGSAK